MPAFEPHPSRRPALVTGASSGIGEATAWALHEQGHPVVVAARRTERLETLATKISADGGEALAVELDLADPGSIDRCATTALEAYGEIDIVVANAGVVGPYTALGADPDVFCTNVQVNLLGTQRLLSHLGPSMVEQGHGDIVFVSSDVVVRPRTHMSSYVAAKAVLEGLARAMQMELEGTGVRAGMVRPGPSSTEQGTDWDEDTINHIIPTWQHWGLLRHNGALQPINVANAIVTMVSVPKGTHLTLIEIEPEAPVRSERTYR